MIKYAVQCNKGHQFEGWFSDSATFDRQAKRGLIACPSCGSAKVTKALMAPNVSSSTRRKGKTGASATAAKVNAQLPAAPEQTQSYGAAVPQEVLELMRKVRDEVRANAEYVGPRFAEEALKIHHDDAPSRGIYGEASVDEVKALHDEGVDCMPLPILPEDHN